MDRFDRIFQLNHLLQTCRRPISHEQLQERLECSRATVTRTIEDLRDFLNAPLEYDRKANGYFYNRAAGDMYELPGLWFNTSELHALLSIQELLSHMEPGLLGAHLSPLRKRIDEMLQHKHTGGEALSSRIRILRMAARPAGPCLQTVADALSRRRRLRLNYLNRETGGASEREVSPQRLIHYRDNWYLDAWCHLRKALRTFAVDAIQAAQSLEKPTKDLSTAALDQHYASAFGIFAGHADKTAVLCFARSRSPWVCHEQWHPNQEGVIRDDGRFELRIPYHDSRELIMDILKYGPDIEVIAPQELRQEVRKRLVAALDQY